MRPTGDKSGRGVPPSGASRPDDRARGRTGRPAAARAGVTGEEDGGTEEIICFTRGTLIRTPAGDRRIETLAPGDAVVTLDHGVQVLRWIGSETVRATGRMAPVCFARGTVGNFADLLVSPWHRMLCEGGAARRLFREDEVLAPALALVDDFEVSVAYGGMVTYVHLLFDRHEAVIANGAASESFHPGGRSLEALPAPAREALFEAMPGLRSDLAAYGPAIRPRVAAEAARALVTA